jgi:DNA-directed RNA polymerase specialized sigma24 family protein
MPSRATLAAHDLNGIPMLELAQQFRVPLRTAYRWRAQGLAALADAFRRRM